MNTFTHSLLRALPRPTPTSIGAAAPQLIHIRHESSARRMTKRLRLHPHVSFKLTGSSPATSHIIYNPPSASPSVYATPSIFLPKDDVRRKLMATIKPTPEERDSKLPPPLKTPYEKKYHLTPEDFQEIRTLRGGNPDLWTRRKLAEKFNTTPFFIGMVCETTEERKAEMQGRLATIKSRWGKRRAGARLERKRRRAGWGGADGQ